jgi:hypothetical protein
MATFVHGKKTRVFIDKFDLTRYFRDVNSNSVIGTADSTTFGSNSKEHIVGTMEGKATLNGLFETVALVGATQLFDTIKGSDTKSIVTIAPFGHSLGARVIIFLADTSTYTISAPIGDIVKADAGFEVTDGIDDGVFLSDGSAVSTTAVGTGVDDRGIASANGGVAFLSVPVDTRDGTLIVKVQHSANNSTFVDLVTFTTVVASTPTSERIVVPAGTAVSRYLRVSYTVAGTTGAITPVVAFARR